MPAERMILQVSAVVIGLNLLMIYIQDAQIDWRAYGTLASITIGCFLLGQFYRVSGRSPRIGLALICTGLFPIFSWSIVMFNYLLMPTARVPLDQSLIWLDSLFGYDWPSLVAWAAEHPFINNVLRVVYMSTIPQIALLIIILGLTGRAKQLHVVMVSITITSVIAVAFWGGFPSHGPASIMNLAAEVEQLAAPLVTLDYGRNLLRMAAEGPGFISPANVKGLIAFPSYHAVLAFTAAYGMRGIKGLFPVFLIVNTIMIPATMLHGGHHMLDLVAGFALFAFGVYSAEKLVRGMYQRTGDPVILDKDSDASTANATA